MLHLPVFLFPSIAVYSQYAAILFIVILMAGYIGILVLEKQYQKKIYLFSTVIAFCKRNVKYDLAPLYLAVGMIVAIILSEHNSAFYAAYVIAVSDSLAALVGMRYGRLKIFYMKKTYLGSLVFFVFCLLGGLYYLTPYYALVVALSLTLVEVVSIKGLDNLTLPIVSQILLIAVL